ncbi:MAG: GNAT family N-acetyltransferase [Cellulosilyticaceae bacterium]
MLRQVEEKDFEKLYEWVNDNAVRENAYHPKKLSWEEYEVWLGNKIEDPNVAMFMIQRDGNDVGQIRLEKYRDDAIIIYSVDKDYRGQGIGKLAIFYLEYYLRKESNILDGIQTLSAYVKAKNIGSIKVFERNNFKRAYESKHYIVFKKGLKRC